MKLKARKLVALLSVMVMILSMNLTAHASNISDELHSDNDRVPAIGPMEGVFWCGPEVRSVQVRVSGPPLHNRRAYCEVHTF